MESWSRLLAAVGATVHRLALLETAPRRVPSPAQLLSSAAGRSSPEAAAWSASAALKAVDRLQADVVLCITTRAFHPAFWKTAPVILDFVDSLGQSYGQRSGLADSLVKRTAYSALAGLHRRIETEGRLRTLHRVAAGFSDARALGADWVPIVAWDFRQTQPATADHDFVFVGNLGYLPNVAAVRFLAAAWAEIQVRRPGSTLVIAGRHPVAEVQGLARRHGWTLIPDFDDTLDVLGRGRVALAPIEHLSGISTKILDAGAAGVAQVVTPAALRGFAPGLPVVTAELGEPFVAAALSLIEDEPRRHATAAATLAEMSRAYTVSAWQSRVGELFELRG